MDGEDNKREPSQPITLIPWQGHTWLVNGWVICSMDKARLGVPWSLFSHPHTKEELGKNLCSDRQNNQENWMQLSTKESSQNGTDIYASLMSRHLLPGPAKP